MLSGSTAAHAHALLDQTSPAVGSTVASSPGSVTLYFTERLEPKFSGGEVHGPGGGRVDRGASVSGNVMRLSVGGLRAGRYSVNWHALSVARPKEASASRSGSDAIGAEYASRLSARFKE